MKKKSVLKAASVVMCAAIMGTSLSVSSVYAAGTGNASANVQSDVSETNTDETASVLSEETISIIYNGEVLAAMENETPLEDFVRSILGIEKKTTLATLFSNALSRIGISDDEADKDIRMDWVDENGIRTRLLPVVDADFDTTAETLADLYELAKCEEDGIALILFTDNKEIARLSVKVKDESTLVIEKTESEMEINSVAFDANGGELSDCTPILRANGELISYFDVSATYDGYTFVGWFDAKEGGNEVTELTNVQSDMTLYAHWKQGYDDTETVNKYTLTVVSPSGQPKSLTVQKEVTLFELSEILGYDVDSYGVGTASGDESAFGGECMVKTIAELAESGEVSVTGYDSNGNVIGSAKVTKMCEDTYQIILSQDADTDLESGDSTDNSDVDSTDTTDNTNSTDNTNDADRTDTEDDADVTDNSTSGSDSEDAADTTSETVETYTLNIVLTTGTTTMAIVKSNVTVAALAEKLGYDVAEFHLKTSTVTQHTIAGTTTMETIAEMAEDGAVLIIVYNSNGDAIGSAEVTKASKNTFTVTLSKDTNVSLDNPADGKGKGEGEIEEGRVDNIAEKVSTADSNVLPVYGCMGGLMAVLLGVFGILRKKRV